jgi:hypothetical protein
LVGKKISSIKKFLRHLSSKVFREFALAHGLRLPNEQVLILSLLRFPTLIRLLNAPSKGVHEIELIQIAKVFAKSSIEVLAPHGRRTQSARLNGPHG